AVFEHTPPAERWALPFPLAVFGTLRVGFRNHHLMMRAPVAHHARACLPHCYARDIELYFRAGSSAPFEIFVYEPDAWRAVMPNIEALEEFVPGRFQEGGYYRTLAWLHLLPADFTHPAFDAELAAERDLRIEPAQWQQAERVPCWVYSSLEQNRRLRSVGDAPLIWDGMTER
ncbi:MAG: hypothetical protein JNM56_28500, partial [Planctomycetia bacterium]|nr:hypothetical protein [Planctomycetia bacterium]